MAFNNAEKYGRKKKDAYLCYDLCVIGRWKLFGDMELMERINFTWLKQPTVS